MRARLCQFLALFVALISLTVDAQSNPPSTENQETQPAAASQATPKIQDESGKQDESQAPEKRKLRLRFGGLAVGAGYSHFSGPYYPYLYPFGPYGYPGDWYGAALWSPLWSPYPFYGPNFFAYNNGRGEVRLTADPKIAEVYIDGGYAGTADKLKSMWLDPGAYDLTISSAGREPYHQRLYVLSGKSLKITAKLNPSEAKEQP